MADKELSPYERSKNYRKDYLSKHKGFFGLYTCAYCGKIITREKMEVDHVYPIGMAKEKTSGKVFVIANTFWRGTKETKKGINGTWNTVASCHDCNHKKSDKGGTWIVRGYIGKIVYPILNTLIYINILYGSLLALFKDDLTKLFYSALALAGLRAIGKLLLIKSK